MRSIANSRRDTAPNRQRFRKHMANYTAAWNADLMVVRQSLSHPGLDAAGSRDDGARDDPERRLQNFRGRHGRSASAIVNHAMAAAPPKTPLGCDLDFPGP